MITGTVPPLTPVIWDTSLDYREDEGRVYARADTDHKVYISNNQAIYFNPETGEIKVGRR